MKHLKKFNESTYKSGSTESRVIEILRKGFGDNKNIDVVAKELFILFKVQRDVDDAICPRCGSDELTTISNFTDVNQLTGTEFSCDKCGKEFDYYHTYI